MGEEKDVEWNCPSCDKGYCLDCSYTSIQCEEGEYEGESLCSVCYEEECEKSEQKKCCDCERTEDMLDANDIELEEAGKYSRCLDCKDERISNMKMGCMNCGDKVGRHALFVGKIGYNICEPCDIATEPTKITNPMLLSAIKIINKKWDEKKAEIYKEIK
jgi:hypothetical protein